MDEVLLRGAAIAWAQIWQVSALFAIVWVLHRLLASKRPHLATLLWILVLLKCLTPPVWSSPSGLFSWAEGRASIAEEKPAIFSPAKVFPAKLSEASPTTLAESGSAEMELSQQAAILSSRNDPSLPQATSLSAWQWFTLVAAVIWLVGCVLFVAVALRRLASFQAKLHQAGKIENETLAAYVESLSERLGLKRKVRLHITAEQMGPAVIGLWRPTLLLPAALVEGKSLEELEPLLAHELLHIRRGDLWVAWLQIVAQGVWWFHPLVRWAGWQVTQETERSCDEEVIAHLKCSPATYARHLIDVLALQQTLKPVPVFPGVRSVDVTRKRLERIMELRQGCHKQTPLWCWGIFGILALVALPGAAYWVVAEEKVEDTIPVQTITVAATETKKETLKFITTEIDNTPWRLTIRHRLPARAIIEKDGGKEVTLIEYRGVMEVEAIRSRDANAQGPTIDKIVFVAGRVHWNAANKQIKFIGYTNVDLGKTEPVYKSGLTFAAGEDLPDTILWKKSAAIVELLPDPTLVVKTYNVGDLLDAPVFLRSMDTFDVNGKSLNKPIVLESTAKGLMDLVKETIDPRSFDSYGGEGTAEISDDARNLTVKNVEAVHSQIADQLATVRRMVIPAAKLDGTTFTLTAVELHELTTVSSISDDFQALAKGRRSVIDLPAQDLEPLQKLLEKKRALGHFQLNIYRHRFIDIRLPKASEGEEARVTGVKFYYLPNLEANKYDLSVRFSSKASNSPEKNQDKIQFQETKINISGERASLVCLDSASWSTHERTKELETTTKERTFLIVVPQALTEPGF